MGKLIQDAHVPVINPVENKVRGCDDEAETQEPPEKRRKLTDGDLAIFEMLTWHLAFDGERGGRSQTSNSQGRWIRVASTLGKTKRNWTKQVQTRYLYPHMWRGFDVN